MVDKSDPMLSKKGALSAKEMASENGDLKNLNISPIYGEFRGFPKTVLFWQKMTLHTLTKNDC